MKLFNRTFRKKKGSAVLEFTIITPIAMLMFWFSIQFITYIVYVNTNYQAAIEASKFVELYMRGTDVTNSVPTSDTTFDTEVKKVIAQTLQNNPLNEMTGNINSLTIVKEPNGTPCDVNALADESICITSTTENFQVYIKSKYKLTGATTIVSHFFNGSEYVIGLTGSGVTPRQNASKFKYN